MAPTNSKKHLRAKRFVKSVRESSEISVGTVPVFFYTKFFCEREASKHDGFLWRARPGMAKERCSDMAMSVDAIRL